MVTVSDVMNLASSAQAARITSFWEDPRLLHRRVAALQACHPAIAASEILERLLAAMDSYAYFQEAFAARLLTEPLARKRVLDVGCGGGLAGCIADMANLCEELDGVDPTDAVVQHPNLSRRWKSCFETAPIPAQSYDLAFAFNVVEHIAEARPFFAKVKEVLKPGGVFWASTPNSRHVFAKLSRAGELIGLKAILSRGSSHINSYPAYYRLNSAKQVLRAISGLGFSAAEFFHEHAFGWERTYFPRGMRWLGRAFDHLIATPIRSRRVIVCYRLVA